MDLNVIIVILYLLAMLAFGWWGKRRTKNASDYLVAGRRLGPFLYTGTMSALVLGGASTVGGVALGFEFGISGMWLVIAIACGVLAISLFFAGTIQKLKIFTVSQMLTLRYGARSTETSSMVMLGYTLMLSVTSTTAYATIFTVLFDIDRFWGVLIGGGIVVIYSSIGGMWSITLADIVQFGLMTIGLFALMLPFTWNAAGGYQGIVDRLGQTAFDPAAIGMQTIITFFVIYTLGLLIGQDIWQRVFTARSPRVARWGGAAAGVYCMLYGVAGALIGTAAAAFMTGIENSDAVYAAVAQNILPVGLGGVVLAAGVAAMMSTASGALIASATVARADVVPLVASWFGRKPSEDYTKQNHESDVRGNRWFVLGLGIVVVLLAAVIEDVVTALTIAYDILVGGLLVAILGGLFWKRGTGYGAAASMAAGVVTTLVTMVIVGDVLANEPIYYGLGASLVVYIVVSLITKPTPKPIMAAWEQRVAGQYAEEEAEPAGAGTGSK